MDDVNEVDGKTSLGIVGFALAVVAVLGFGIFGLATCDSIEQSRADRAQSVAAGQEARAGARAAEARAEVDKVSIRAERDVALELNRQAAKIAELQQRQESWEHTFSMYAVAIKNLDRQEMNHLERLMSEGRTDGVVVGLSVALAFLVFLTFLVLRRYVRLLWQNWGPLP
jgi:hypothetical protein